MALAEKSPLNDPSIARARFLEELIKTNGNFDEIAENLQHIDAFRRGRLTLEEIVTGEDSYRKRLAELGWDFIEETIEDNAGIQIRIVLSERSPVDPQAVVGKPISMYGLLTDISGGRRAGPSQTPLFDGMAVLRDDRDREHFATISLELNGVGHLKTKAFQPKFPENWRVQMRQFNLGLKPTSPEPAS